MNNELKAEEYFLEGYACSQAVVMAYADEVGLDMETAKKVSSTFGGGMGRMRKTCGALTGAFMVLGMKHGNTKPDDMETKLNSYEMVRELADIFKEKHGTNECAELLEKYATKEVVKDRNHHKIICNRLVKDAVTMLDEILDKKSPLIEKI